MTSERSGQQAVDDYFAELSEPARRALEQVREVARAAAPGAEETIKYGLPTLVLNGNLVHYGAFKKHIGFYPTPSAMAAFEDDLSAYQRATGSVQFPLDQPMPLELIRRMVEFRLAEARANTRPGGRHPRTGRSGP